MVPLVPVIGDRSGHDCRLALHFTRTGENLIIALLVKVYDEKSRMENPREVTALGERCSQYHKGIAGKRCVGMSLKKMPWSILYTRRKKVADFVIYLQRNPVVRQGEKEEKAEKQSKRYRSSLPSQLARNLIQR